VNLACEAVLVISGEPLEDWRATVRSHTWFGLPVWTMRVTCGGWQWKGGMSIG
jgi:hypothetical protein